MSKIDELRNKYSGITNQIFEKFVDGDTTPTKKYLEFLLKDSLEKLEQSIEPSYISNLKENIDSFLEKLNTKKYGITTTED